MLLTSCSSESSPEIEENNQITIDSFDESDYDIAIPFDLSDARKWHGDYLSKLDQVEIPKGLQEYSKDYFSVENSYLKQGVLLDRDDVQMLQRRESADYPYALNPAAGTFEISSTVSVESPYLVYDVVELDFVSKDDSSELTGISLAMIMNSTIEDEDGNEYYIDEERLFIFASVAGRKLELYMRTKNDVSPDLPIYISFYKANDDEAYLPGEFIGGGLFEGRSGQFSEIDEEWYLLPTTEHSSYDNVLASNYAMIKGQVDDFLPQNISMIAKAKYIDDKLDYFKIDIVMQAKTYTEMYALTQMLNSTLGSIVSADYELIVDIKQNDETVFTITKEKGSTNTVINDLT